MQGKVVIIVENRDAQRWALQSALEGRGFRVYGAATEKEALNTIEALGDSTAVIVLDMRLTDYPNANTGADVGILSRDRHPDWMPEYLINSVHDKAYYYKLAMRLGAAAYLLKNETTQDDVIRHVRALALKRGLRAERLQIAEKIRSISHSARNLSEAVNTFCKEILARELDACLGAPYVLLLTDEGGTKNVATNIDLPAGYENFYFVLQSMAHGLSNSSVPFIVSEADLKQLPVPVTAAEVKIFNRLRNAAFIPLGSRVNFRLSLGLFTSQPGEMKYAEEPKLIAPVLVQFVRAVVVEHFLGILVDLDAQKRAVLQTTADLCLFLGQAQQAIIGEALAREELKEETDGYQKLRTMADDLRQSGLILDDVVNRKEGGSSTHAVFNIRELIESAFADLREAISADEIGFSIEGSGRVKASRQDLYVLVMRILQWLAQRSGETPPNFKAEISVRCFETENSSQVVFEDRSHRLPEIVRRQLFAPLSTSVVSSTGQPLAGAGVYLPLYLAKILVEGKYGGALAEKSSEMEGELGHRLMMSFPLTND